MATVLKINNTTVKAPQDMTWSLEPVSSPDSGRDLSGVMHNDVVAFKTKLACKWPPMTVAESSVLLKSVYTKNNIPVTYLDPMEGVMTTKTFYVGSRTAPKLWETDSSQMIGNISFDFIEV